MDQSRTAPLLSIRNLVTSFSTPKGVARAVDGVSLDLFPGDILAVVGESGCGKTVLALSVLGLVPDPPGRVTDGEVWFKDREMTAMDEDELRGMRGNAVSMVFQEPMTSLNPVFKVGEQIAEGLRLHRGLSKAEADREAVELLRRVSVPEPEKRALSYPHELSGGMRQRVMIAMAISCDPAIIIADEPTTALDVTIQAQILDILRRMGTRRRDTAGILITHDLGVVARLCNRVAVMYAGVVVETAPVELLYKDPLHPYTRGLMRSVPRVDMKRELEPVPGTVPGIFSRPSGCRFHPRCVHAFAPCAAEEPPLMQNGGGRRVRCWLHHPDKNPDGPPRRAAP